MDASFQLIKKLSIIEKNQISVKRKVSSILSIEVETFCQKIWLNLASEVVLQFQKAFFHS